MEQTNKASNRRKLPLEQSTWNVLTVFAKRSLRTAQIVNNLKLSFDPLLPSLHPRQLPVAHHRHHPGRKWLFQQALQTSMASLLLQQLFSGKAVVIPRILQSKEALH